MLALAILASGAAAVELMSSAPLTAAHEAHYTVSESDSEPLASIGINSRGSMTMMRSAGSARAWSGAEPKDRTSKAEDRPLISEERPLSLAVVVVRCGESLEWLEHLGAFVPPPFHLARVHIVQKCASMRESAEALTARLGGPHHGGAPPAIAVTNLKNVGSELYGYVTHIIDYYDNLEDYTAFLSGHPTSSFDFCNLGDFLKVALDRGYAGLGFHYSQSSTNGFVRMDSCPGRGVALGGPHDHGVTVGISGSQFIANRSAIHKSKVEVFHEYQKCFDSLLEATDMESDEALPGAADSARWEHYGHMLFGMPRVLPDQKVASCTERHSSNYQDIVMPFLSVLPLWSPVRLSAICLALILPTCLAFFLCSSQADTFLADTVEMHYRTGGFHAVWMRALSGASEADVINSRGVWKEMMSPTRAKEQHC